MSVDAIFTRVRSTICPIGAVSPNIEYAIDLQSLETRKYVDEGSSEIEAIDVQFIRPEALGEPGQRRFRLLRRHQWPHVIAWMEKEQVGRLGELLLDVLERLPRDRPKRSHQYRILPDEDHRRTFRAGRMELSYDEEDDRLIV